MATATKSGTPPTAAAEPKTTLDHLQQALEDLEKVRAQAQQEAHAGIDDAADRIRDAVTEMRSRTLSEIRELQDRLGDLSEDALREFGRAAVYAQRTPEALAEMASEIRRRKQRLIG